MSSGAPSGPEAGAEPRLMRKRIPTLEMVASRAGVSRATVSRVVNGVSTVAPEAVERIQQAIEELNYVPNRAARSLASNRTGAVALVVPETTVKVFSDPFFGSVVQGIAMALAETDYTLNMIIESESNAGKTRRYLMGGNVDGALIVSHHTGDRSYSELLEALPMVFAGQPMEDTTGATAIDVDNVDSARAAVDYLIAHGRRRIATITGPDDMRPGIDRAEGWRQALEAAGLEPGPRFAGDFTLDGGARAARELIDSGEPFDAIFAANDLMAMGAYPVLRKAGLTIPGDVAVIGFDDSPASQTADPPLTTMRQPMIELGAQMARQLLRMMNGETPPQLTVLRAHLIERGSV